jgi:hypothetical protein
MTRRSPWAALALAAVIVAAVVLIDRYAPVPTAAAGPAAAVAVPDDPVAGSWVCAVGDGREGTTLDTSIARPAIGGTGPASVDLLHLHEGEADTTSLPALFPPSHTIEGLDDDRDDVATWARWSGAPAAVSREWRWEEDAEDLPAATVAGPCAQPFSPQWTIPGMSSAGGHEARLRLANPYRTDATVAVHFVTPEGVRAPIALQNWTVPARTVREINVNEVLPEEDDLAAVVQVETGRLSVEGYQITRSAIGGVDGASLLAAAPAPEETWTVPWVADRDDATSWLWIANTGDRTATVELTLHTPDGGDVPDGLAEVTVPPGELRRVELGGTLPDGQDEVAVTARSDGAPVVVSAATRIVTEEEEPEDDEELDLDELEALEDLELDDPADDQDTVAPQTGFAVQLGVPGLDTSWSVSGGAVAGRGELVRLANPSGEDALVDVVLFDGSRAVEPDELQDVAVPAGSAVSVPIEDHLGDVGAWTAFVTASEGQLAVGRVGWAHDDALHLVAIPGVPGSRAVPTGEALAGVEAAGLVHRLGTDLGLVEADPFDVPTRPAEPGPVVPDDAELDELFDDELDPQPEDGDPDEELDDGLEDDLDDPDGDPDDEQLEEDREA